VHLGLHDHREQRPVDPAAGLQQRREERSLPQLGDPQLDITGLVDSSRLRVPLRWVVRVSVRSYRLAPICWAASASINACRTRVSA
jgi:hypothetical protein